MLTPLNITAFRGPMLHLAVRERPMKVLLPMGGVVYRHRESPYTAVPCNHAKS